MPERKEKTLKRSDERPRPTLNLTRTVIREVFNYRSRPWDAIPYLHDHVRRHGDELPYDEYDEIADGVWVHVSAYVSPTCKIDPPTIICGGARICHYAHVEGSVIGAFATVGDLSHVKNSIMFDRSCLCGRNSLYSSILGYEAMIGDGTTVADSRLDGMNVTVSMPEGLYVLGRERLGGIICDGVRIGANCIINPGAVIDNDARIFPLTSISGYVYPYSTIK